MYYAINKARSRTKNTKPSLTDQAAARETDRNVIVKRFMVSGQVPGGKQPMFGDFSILPNNLKDFIRIGKSLKDHRANLPPELRNLPLHELLALTTKELAEKLKKPEPPAPDKAGKPEGETK